MLEHYAFLFFLCYNYLGFSSGYLASLIVWGLLGFVVTKVNYVFLKTPPDVKAFRRYNELIPTHDFLMMVTFLLWLRMFSDFSMSSMSSRSTRSTTRNDSARLKGISTLPGYHVRYYSRHTALSALELTGPYLDTMTLMHARYSQTLAHPHGHLLPVTLSQNARYSKFSALSQPRYLTHCLILNTLDRGAAVQARDLLGAQQTDDVPTGTGISHSSNFLRYPVQFLIV